MDQEKYDFAVTYCQQKSEVPEEERKIVVHNLQSFEAIKRGSVD